MPWMAARRTKKNPKVTIMSTVLVQATSEPTSSTGETFCLFGFERLADSAHRDGLRPYVRQPRWSTGNPSIESNPENWCRYQSRLVDDAPVESTIRLLRMVASSDLTTIVIVANVDARHEVKVREWLCKYAGPQMNDARRVLILTRTVVMQTSIAAKYSASSNAMDLIPKIASTGASCVLAVTANGPLSKVLRTHFPTTFIVRGNRAGLRSGGNDSDD